MLSSNSVGVTRAFPKGFLDRPASVIEDYRKSKINKSIESKDKFYKPRGNKSNRGGTPAPAIQKNKNKSNTSLGVGSTARFSHHSTQNKNRNGSAKKKLGSKFNINMQEKQNKKDPKS